MGSNPVQTRASIRFGEGYELDLRPRRLRRGKQVLKLERIPLEILILLIERKDEVVTRGQIVNRVWGQGVFLDSDNSIRGAIRKLRVALRDDAATPRFIETVTGQGYRFIAPVVSGEESETTVSTVVGKEHESEPFAAVAKDDARTQRTYTRVALGGIALIAVLAVGFLIAMRLRPAHSSSPKITSIAVLPLKNLSPDSSQEYLADGMTEALIGSLSGIHDLRVISRTSVMHFKETKLTVPDIARTLHVDAVVEGSVITDGRRIRVHAQLIRAATDEHFWSEEYDRELKDVLALQSELAQAIAEKVEVTVTGQERSKLATVRHVSPDVYESYLKAELGKGNTRDEVEQNISHFEEAIRKDPTFAPAYVGLAEAYGDLGTVFMGVPPGEVRPKVLTSARKALELDPENAEAHTIVAGIYQELWHWSEAETEYKRALELNTNDPAAHLGLADWLLAQGRFDDALVESQRARELDPIEVTGTANGWILFQAHRYDEAIRELRSVVAVRPDSATAHWFLGYALIASGQPENAIPELEKARSLSGGSSAVIGVLIRAYAHAGRRSQAFRLLNELKLRQERGYVPAGAFVNAYLGLDEKEEAFASLERAYQEQSNILQWLKVHPHFDPLRSDPRFAELLRRVGLAG